MVQWPSPCLTTQGPICDSPPFVGIHSVERESNPPIRSILSACWAELCCAVVVVVVLLAAVVVARDELSGDKIGGRASVHVSRIIFLVATSLLGSCR